MRRTIKAIFVALAMVQLAACASDDDSLQSDVSLPPSETQIAYEAVLEGAPTEEIGGLLEDSLSIFRLAENGAPSPAFLTRRLQSDEAVAQTILKSEGFYLGAYAFEIVPPALKEGQTEIPPDAPWTAIVRIDAGEAFTLAAHSLTLTEDAPEAPELDATALGSPIGGQARAEQILGAEQAAVARLRESGFFYAKGDGRRALADLEEKTITVESRISPGPFVRFGQTTIEGADSIDHDFLLTYQRWEEGAPVQRSRIDGFQRELSQTGLFSSVSVRPPDAPEDVPADGVAPIMVTAEERLPQSVTAGVRFHSDDGLSARVSYRHRNLLGAGETLRGTLDLSIVEPEILIDFRKPQYLRDQQDLIAGANAAFRDDDVYTGFSSEFTLGIERALNPRWTVGAGGSFSFDNIEDDIEGVDTGRAYLLGLPMFVTYDGSNNLLNPTEGLRMRFNATPYTGTYDDEPVAYMVIDGNGAAYYDIAGDGRWVLAGRGRIGSVLSGELETTTPTKRLYSGGGGSVRGYQRDFIGPIDEDGSPSGGLSVVEVGTELRAPISGDIGGVVFLEGGSVSTEVFPNFEEDVQWAAGLGFRYYSPVGPVRLDVGVPLNPRDVDNDFEFYFAIGQAF